MLDPDRRPRTYCRELKRREKKHIVTPMTFNSEGVAISEERAKWSSWVGRIARTRLDIKYRDWRKVPKSVKQTLWEECKVMHTNFLNYFISNHMASMNLKLILILTIYFQRYHSKLKRQVWMS